MTRFDRLLPYIRPYRRGILGGLLFVVLSNLAGIAAPWLLGRAIDALTAAGLTLRVLAIYAGLIVVTAILSGIARFGMRQLLNGVSRRIENDLRNDLFGHMLSLDAAFFGRNTTGDLMSRATNDTQAVRMAIGPGVMYLVNTIVLTVLALAVMTRYSLKLTAIALLPLLTLPPLMIVFGRTIHRRFEKIQEHLGLLSTMVQENLSGVRIVRAYTQEKTQEAEFEELNRVYLDKNMSLARVSALFHPLLGIVTGLGVLVVLWVGGNEVIAGRLTAGEFVAFFFYVGLLTWPMIALGWVVNLYQRGAASMRRIDAVMGVQALVRPPEEPESMPAVRGEIEFRDVWFRYPGTERNVLRGVSFRIEAGRTGALVGPTGSGKSTIVALLTRRYDPTRGVVLLDGVPLPRVPMETLRASLGLVPQDAFVFSETIAGNISLGLPPGVEAADRIEEAAAVAMLTETIAGFPAGFETRLGERGINLSGGQRQRTTLARALARDPRVLILDDSLSAVDTHTETLILRGLRRVLATRTSLIISHRVSAVMNADKILVLDEGRIVERGTHGDLIASGGLYSTLLRRQLLAEGLEQPLATASAEI